MNAPSITLEDQLKRIVDSVIEAVENPGPGDYAALHSWGAVDDPAGSFTVIVLSGDHYELAKEFLAEKLPEFRKVKPS